MLRFLRPVARMLLCVRLLLAAAPVLLPLVVAPVVVLPASVLAQGGDPLMDFDKNRKDLKASADQAKSQIKAKQSKIRELSRYIGDLTMDVYGVAVVLFVVIPVGMFIGLFIYNITFRPFFQRRRTLKALRRNAKTELKDLPGEARKMMKKRRYREAADLFVRAGDDLRAAGAYEKAGELGLAAGLYGRRHPKDAARIYTELNQFREAAKAWEAARLPSNAASAWLKARDPAAAARCYEQAGNLAEAARLYESEGNLHKAAKLLGQAGDTERSARIYEQIVAADRGTAAPVVAPQRAEQVMQQAQAFRIGQEAAVTRTTLVDAVLVSVTNDQVEAAADLYSRADSDISDEVLAKIPYHSNDAVKFAQMFLKARDYKAAASVFDQLGHYHEAAELYARNGDYYMAGEMFEMAGMLAEAAENHRKGGAPTRAAPLYVQLGDKVAAAECYEQVDQLYDAAELYFAAGDHARALALFQRVPQADPGYLQAQERIASLSQQGVRPRRKTGIFPAVSIPPAAPSVGAVVEDPFADADFGTPGDDEELLVGSMDGIEWLRESTYFSELSLDELRVLYGMCDRRSFAAGQPIIQEGDQGEYLFIIKKGRCGITKASGQELDGLRLAELRPGDHFGEISLLTGIPATARVSPLEDTEVFVIGREALDRFLGASDAAALKMFQAFTRALAYRLRDLNSEMVTHQA